MPEGGTTTPRPEERLISLLSELAVYNDKGAVWRGHTPAEMGLEYDFFRRELATTIAQIGEAQVFGQIIYENRQRVGLAEAPGPNIQKAGITF